TRTKFGANNVAEYLCKNGINAMALHGNKSQSARTQALGGFKSGEIRALVATDIAARGIDIDDLPHVVNFEIPNVPEDYVHRIGRTGRAGAEGQAVSFVCLDEEGFMKEIERFTRQQIPTVVIEGFAPEAGERAEPIAMGRQTIWGGLGKPPGREVMAAAAKAARQEMMQRIRDNKAADGERSGNGRGNGTRNGARNGNGNGRGQPQPGQRAPQPQHAKPRNGHQQPAPRRDDSREAYDEDRIPSNIDPLRTNMPGRREMTGVQRVNVGGQPDPTRTSIDSMGAGRRGGGNRNRGNGGGQRPPSRYAR
ncbi:MAG TPA: helicase-related protein, partial [Ramlibacter sp.]|nr:helicase-related protein [Ramlibacter sp.]